MRQQIINDDYSIAIALADSFIAYKYQFAFPIATIVAYILKKGLLKTLCECA